MTGSLPGTADALGRRAGAEPHRAANRQAGRTFRQRASAVLRRASASRHQAVAVTRIAYALAVRGARAVTGKRARAVGRAELRLTEAVAYREAALAGRAFDDSARAA